MNQSSPIQRHTFAHTPTVRINYEVYGSGDSILIFLHGFGASLESWRDILPLMVQERRIYLLDLKGFGLSSKPNDNEYSLEDQARIVTAFINANKLKNVTLVGHSFGGAVCLLTYFMLRVSTERRTISRLVLIDASGYLQQLPFFISILRKPIISWIVMNLVPATARAGYTLRHLFFNEKRVTEERILRYAKYFNQPGSYTSFVTSAAQILPLDPDAVSRQIKLIDVPTLIVWGEEDPIIPLENAHRFHRDIENSKLVVLPQCGHIPQEEIPAATIDALLNFLNQ